MPDKLAQLEKMLAQQPRDSFLLYALGMEHKKLGDLRRAIEFYSRTIEVDPNYCYAYYQRGQALEHQGDTDAARQSYRDGVDAALRTNDEHAKGELESAMQMLPPPQAKA
jgi:tetratricopeptide (TPR) repeat protein